MKNIVKTFVEVYVLDIEGRNGEWKPTTDTYEKAAATLNGWRDAVRVVEKTFNPDAFTITEKEVKVTEKVYNGWTWKGETREIIR